MIAYERPPVLRGVHFGPGTKMGFDIAWWVEFLKSMHMGWMKIVDDAGSMMEFAAACRAAGIMPIIRLYRQYPYPGRLSAKDIEAVKEYIRRGITRWFELSNEPNLWDPEWHPDHRPVWHEGDPAIYEGEWFNQTAIPMIMRDWLADSETIIGLGGYPAFPALAQCGFHKLCGSIPFYRAMFNCLSDHYFERTQSIFQNGGWLAVHDATLNHFYRDEQGVWHFEYPYDPNCQARHPGRTIMDDDNSLLGHEAPRDMIWNRWQLRLPIISTEGGIFLDVGTQWDRNYPPISSAEYQGEASAKMFKFLDNYQRTHPWWFGMCPWIVAGQILGHPTHWEDESWKKVDREEPVVRILQASPPRQIDDPEPPDPSPPPPPPPAPENWPRPPGDNGIGIHFGLGKRLVGDALGEDIARAKALKATWGVVGFGAGEDVMLSAAERLYAAGIMPIVRKVMNISGRYDFARDTRLLLDHGIPAYVQVFNEPSDSREWESNDQHKKCYPGRWADWSVEAVRSIATAGGHPGLQLLHPRPLENGVDELGEIFARLPASDRVWKKVWFSAHNYGLNHPPDFREDYWGVLGFLDFADRFMEFLGFVPPMICGEGGWLFGASDDDRFPRIGADLHAAYHKKMYEWFRFGRLSNGDPLPDYLFAVCPWILSGPEAEAWYGPTTKTATIEAVKGIPMFTRDGAAPPPPPPPPPPPLIGEELLDEYNLTIEACKMPGYKVVKLEERCESNTCDVRVQDVDGNPIVGFQVRWGWPGQEVRQPTDPHGRAGFAMGRDSYYSPEEGQAGPHWTMAGVGVDSEVVKGIGMVAGTVHCTVNPTFRYVMKQEPEPVPLPYTLKDRLKQAPDFEDLRPQIQAISDMDALNKTARRDDAGNPLFHLIEFIVVHHSGNPDPHTPMSMARQAMKEGEPTIEYHICIQGGKIFWTAAFVHVTNHTYRLNRESIAVCILGDYSTKEPSAEDLEALRFVIAALYEFFGQGWGQFRLLGLVPHRKVKYNSTACPGKVWSRALWGGEWPQFEEMDEGG